MASAGQLLWLVCLMSLSLCCSLSLQQSDGETDDGEHRGEHLVTLSEYNLRSTVATLNKELRQLKRDFMRDMTDIYLLLRMDPEVGFEELRRGERPTPALVMLFAEQFAQIAIKRHIIQRRLVQGLKVAFVKMLPMRTLRRLYDKYQAYAWLRDQEQVDVRPKFPEVRENHLVKLNSLIELRARIRAADDLISLTEEHVRRILQTVQYFLIESRHDDGFSAEELNAMASHGKRVLDYYLDHVQNPRNKLQTKWDQHARSSKILTDSIGGSEELVKFIDDIINVEALDIDLNEEASGLEVPPTINEQMMVNLEKKWIPNFVLSSLGQDREQLMDKKHFILDAVIPDEDKVDADVSEWAYNAVKYLCSNSAVTFRHF